jgi:hypothetical protein
MYDQSHYREVDFYEKFGFRLVGNAEKEIGLIMSNFCGQFFQVFKGKKHFEIFENNVASALKRCIKWKVRKM